jgi:hypothetical protein
MIRNTLLSMLAVLGLIAFSARASIDQLMSELVARQQAIDGDHIAKPSVLQSLDANGNVNDALKAAIKGDSKALPDALTAAQSNLDAVAKQLPDLVKKGLFKKPLNKPIKVHDYNTNSDIEIVTGDQALSRIAQLSSESSAAIERINSEKGGQEELALAVRNSSEISMLILAFYSGVGS